MKPDHALRAMYYTGEHREIPAMNYTLLHGVRATLAMSGRTQPRRGSITTWRWPRISSSWI